MQPSMNQRVRSHPAFAELVRRRDRLGRSLSLLIIAIYFAFILVIAFAPKWLGIPLYEGAATSIGIPIGVALIVISFIATGIYVRIANATFDRLNRQIVEDVQ